MNGPHCANCPGFPQAGYSVSRDHIERITLFIELLFGLGGQDGTDGFGQAAIADQSTHLQVSHPTASAVFHGPRKWMNPALNWPVTDPGNPCQSALEAKNWP